MLSNSNSLSLVSLSMTDIKLKKKKKYHSEEHATEFCQQFKRPSHQFCVCNVLKVSVMKFTQRHY